MVKSKVAIESNPLLFLVVKVYVPVCVYVFPFQVKLSHAVCMVVEVPGDTIVKSNVATESQPLLVFVLNV